MSTRVPALAVMLIALTAATAPTAAGNTDASPDDDGTRRAKSTARRAALLAEKQDWPAAEAAYREAVAADPEYAEGWNGLGHTLAKQNRPDEALDAYDEALRIEPDHAQALERLGVTYVAMGRIEDAEAILVRLRPIDSRRGATLGHVIAVGRGER